LAFTGWLSDQKVVHANILIQVRPVNTLTLADQPPVLPFFGGAMNKSGILKQRHNDGPPIEKVNG
jgi:hypothetical protein